MFSNMTAEREVVPKIDSLILLDRSVDFLTPLSTQLTYEGLIDEIYGIRHSKSLRVSVEYTLLGGSVF